MVSDKLRMSLDLQLYNLLCEYIYGNLCLTLEICDDFLTRGNEAGWPQQCWAYMPRVLVMRDLLRLALNTLGEVPVLGVGGSVASAWNTWQYVTTGGGQDGRVENTGSDDWRDDLPEGGLGEQGLSGSGLRGNSDSIGLL